MSVGYRILIHEPDAELRQGLTNALSGTTCNLVWCDKYAEAVALLGSAEIDIAVVSLSPDGTGSRIVDQICRVASTIPFLVATPVDQLETRMLGLDRGAVDYLIWPYTADELLARVSTALRRREGSRERFVRRGQIVLDRETGRVGNGSTWTVLSPKESTVFSLLFGCGDRPVSKQRLRSALSEGGRITDNAIEVGIHRLRVKARSWGMQIETYRGVGYTLKDI